jgi:hypothetical protein
MIPQDIFRFALRHASICSGRGRINSRVLIFVLGNNFPRREIPDMRLCDLASLTLILSAVLQPVGMNGFQTGDQKLKDTAPDL